MTYLCLVCQQQREQGCFKRNCPGIPNNANTAPPPPAEMLEEAKKKVLMPADMLAKARRGLAHAASVNDLYQQDYDDFCAAIDAARGK